MPKTKKIILLVSLFLIPAIVSAVSGEDLYIKNCGKCHGEDRGGKIDVGLAPAISPDLPASYLKQVISDGRDPANSVYYGSNRQNIMPTWKYYLTEGEIEDIVAYLRS